MSLFLYESVQIACDNSVCVMVISGTSAGLLQVHVTTSLRCTVAVITCCN